LKFTLAVNRLALGNWRSTDQSILRWERRKGLSTASAPPPTFCRVQPSVSLHGFSQVSGNVSSVPDKSSAADPLPTDHLLEASCWRDCALCCCR